jgi:hypothetical protein
MTKGKFCLSFNYNIEFRNNSQFSRYEFEYDNDFDNGSVPELTDLISTKRYPCKLLKINFILLVRISDDPELSNTIRERSIFGVQWFMDRCSSDDRIISGVYNCCINQQLQIYQTHNCSGITRNIVSIKNFNIAYKKFFPKLFFVHTMICNCCKMILHYDGREVGLVNINNNLLFAAELFYELLNLKSTCGISTSTW